MLAAVANSTGDITALFEEIAVQAGIGNGSRSGVRVHGIGRQLVTYGHGPDTEGPTTVEAPNTELSGLVHVFRGRPRGALTLTRVMWQAVASPGVRFSAYLPADERSRTALAVGHRNGQVMSGGVAE